MPDSQDLFAPHLQRAQDLFQAGEVIQAGQIWQAILRQDPTHAGARACLIHVKHWIEEREKAGDPVHLGQTQAPVDLNPQAQAIPEPASVAAIPAPIPENAPPPVPAPPMDRAIAPMPMGTIEGTDTPDSPDSPSDDVNVDQTLRHGCTLYDMGQVEEALERWEMILAVEPHHRLALEYVASARQELARQASLPQTPQTHQTPVPHAPIPYTQEQPVSSPIPEVQELASGDTTGESILEGRLFSLLQEGLNHYDQGDVDAALNSWKEMLALDPDNEDAKAYLSMAQRDTGSYPIAREGSASSGSRPGGSTTPIYIKGKALNPEGLEQKCRQGERLTRLKRYEQAVFDFQLVLAQDPTHPRALRGLEQLKALMADEPTPPEPGPDALEESTAVTPPASVTAAVQPLRSGPALPAPVNDLTRQYPWLKSPAVWGGAIAIGVLGSMGFFFLKQHQKDLKLQSDRSAFSDSTLAQVNRGNQPQELAESPANVRSEAEQAIGDDPLRAYHRAKELLRLNPADSTAAQLMDRARQAMAEGGLKPTTLGDFQKHVQQGDLESAEVDIDALLRASPDDGQLIQRACRLYLVVAQLQASKEHWGDARDVLKKGRALQPTDPAWQGRLRLLEKIPAQPKSDQAGWIALLG